VNVVVIHFAKEDIIFTRWTRTQFTSHSKLNNSCLSYPIYVFAFCFDFPFVIVLNIFR
jgi:hypothetical protein